ncbi:zinc-binding metallopeptidase family protein [Cupriavidus sp. 30B13]|uniref:zinc-binding metallopeptidase family protein n=1 Tax=Cupriavidus sp. 30B13 TaxID=3384241 RepID=UPI003B8FAC84
MKTFHCGKCSNLVFFENVTCERCNALLGYVPELSQVCAFEPAGEDNWRCLNGEADGALYRQCHNYAVQEVCNWMIPADSENTLCDACQLTRTTPFLATPNNRLYWWRLETAKRRVLYTLAALGLPVVSREVDAEGGLQFDFLEDVGEERVMTGHDNGLITMNIAEADDAHREKTRSEMSEPYRTLLGHFRHEIGHYYFDRLVAGTRWLEPFRALFGDERADYAAALAAHYEQGTMQGWEQAHVSAYATMHPWEDWAETWAHYLHIVDTVDTAAACGLELNPSNAGEPVLTDQTPVEVSSFDSLMNRWYPLTYVLNSLNRSLGLADGYPFALSPKVVEKLRFVHDVVAAGPQPKIPEVPAVAESTESMESPESPAAPEVPEVPDTPVTATPAAAAGSGPAVAG